MIDKSIVENLDEKELVVLDVESFFFVPCTFGQRGTPTKASTCVDSPEISMPDAGNCTEVGIFHEILWI